MSMVPLSVMFLDDANGHAPLEKIECVDQSSWQYNLSTHYTRIGLQLIRYTNTNGPPRYRLTNTKATRL